MFQFQPMTFVALSEIFLSFSTEWASLDQLTEPTELQWWIFLLHGKNFIELQWRSFWLSGATATVLTLPTILILSISRSEMKQSFKVKSFIFHSFVQSASKDLGYLRLITSLGFQDLQEAFPWRTSLASKGLKTEFYKYYEEEDKTQIVNHKSQVFEGFHLIIHDPFELPTRDSSHYHAMTNSTVVIWIKVEASKVIESLYDFSPAE